MGTGDRSPGPDPSKPPVPHGREESSGEATFGDLLNRFSFDSGRGRRRRQEPDSVPAPAESARPSERETTQPRLGSSAPGVPSEDDEPAYDEREDSAAIVRAYTWTRGRTTSHYHLELETLVSTTERGRDTAALAQEYRSAALLCSQPRSVAEVAALLSVPLRVARVLLGDMAGLGLLTVHQTASGDGDAPNYEMLERVLSGLHRL